MTTIYLKTRKTAFNTWQGLYTVDYLYNQERKWYVENAAVTFDTIPDNYITDVKGRGLTLVTFDETKVSLEDLTFDLEQYRWSKVYSAEATQVFLRNNSTLTESSANTFSYSWEASELQEVGTKNYVIA